jgi:NAD(P)-dependent dehydrogenase (short-subunit alcohol dehydrogenase family)
MQWNVEEKTILITGANSGLGKATAMGLAERGAHVVMTSRNLQRGEKARREIARKTGNERVDLLVADLSTTDGVRGLAEEFRASHPRLDVLINNAAVLTGTRQVTSEGHERQLFVNHLAYFMLTNLLIDMLKASAPARVINVTSTAHSSGTIDFNDIQYERSYKGYRAYANTKLMNMVFTYELARRVDGTGVTANCVHPGVIHTGLLRNFSFVLNAMFNLLSVFFKKAHEGAETPIYLAASPEVGEVTGKYFKYCKPLGSSEESYDQDVQRRLWEVSATLTGLTTTV